MIAAFFHDERFSRDAAGRWFSTSGAIPHRALARYLGHFDRVVVVGRLDAGARPGTGTLASGDGIEWACVDAPGGSIPRYLLAADRRVREVVARVDAAVVRVPGLVAPLACRAALRAGLPLLVEVVGDPFDSLWNHGSLAGKLTALPLSLANRHYVRRARFATTGWTLQRRYPTDGVAAAVSDVIIDPPRPEILSRRLAALARRTPGAPATLGLIGSYGVSYKGHETALRAVARLRAGGRAVTLRCVGVGDPGLVAALLDDSVELAAQARRSWETAARFAAAELDARRDAVLRGFAASCAEDGQAREGASARAAQR